MNYLKTKDNIYLIQKDISYGGNQIYKVYYHDFAIIGNHKVADNIAKLCDVFVYIKDGIVSQYLTIDFKFKREDEFCSLRNKLTAGVAEISRGISKYELENGELKGAIWTDKGLIYVAQMNNEGELELLWK